MARHFLKYWLPATIQQRIDTGDLLITYSASSQYRKRGTQIGDAVWIVTMFPQSGGQLLLCGWMRVGRICDQDEAAQILGRNARGLWQADTYALAYPNQPERMQLIDITPIATDLRFISKAGRDRLSMADGGLKAQALQTMRELTPKSAALLDSIWRSHQK